MRNYKLIASDLDGTLIGSDMSLTKENRRAIKELTDMGVIVVPATGRTVCEMREIADLPEIRYVIYSNGAAILDKATEEIIFLGINEEATRFLMTTLFKYDTYVIIHRDGKSYGDRKELENPEKYHVSFNVKEIVRNFCIYDDNFEENALSGGGIESVSVFFANKEELDECRKILDSHPMLKTVMGWGNSIEVFNKEAGKGSALEVLANKLGISMQEVISIGDSDNDTQMICMAGMGLATDNACESLKKVADKTICSNDEHVMSYVKDNFFDLT